MKRNLKLMLDVLSKYYIIYALITGLFIFAISKPKTKKINPPNFNKSNSKYSDRVGLIDGSFYSGLVRLNLIDEAEESIDISYYTIIFGGSTDIFFTKLIDASNRGVKVRILLDGIFHNMRGDFKDSLYMLASKENIELKFYEPLNIVKPWTLNNRLHDKIIIVDDSLALIGGRNIGDKYFLEESDDINLVKDRDVLIYRNEDILGDSIIYTMKEYYNHIWNHQYSKYPISEINQRQKKKAYDFEKKSRDRSSKIQNKYLEDLEEIIDWKELTETVEKLEFVHNPVVRLNKKPWALNRLLKLAEESEEQIIAQSPYIILSKKLKKELNNYNIDYNKINILTNSYKSTPNFPAISGYHNDRKEIVDKVNKVYEYHGEHSIHGKSYIFDNHTSVVGSFNLDPRSAFLSTESYLIIYDKNFTKKLENNMAKDIDKSLQVGEDYQYLDNDRISDRKVPFLKMSLIKILSKITYFIDYML